MVTLQDIDGNKLFRNITFVKHVSIPDQKEDKVISIKREKKTYPIQKTETIYY